jgi:biofilm PGA synthesis N-glycosyltransferase PgaC
MNGLEFGFWCCAALLAYTYVGYPLLLGCWARLRGRPVARAPFAGSVSVVVAARNEAENVVRRLQELTGLVRATGWPGEVILVSDGSTDRTLERLLENFADPHVGAVSGDLDVDAVPGVMAGVGMYWRYEKWLRRQEGHWHSTVGVTGAISAVRRELFHGVPAGTLLDDVYWPLQVAMQEFRVIHDGRAKAYDRLPARPRDEFRRKVRTLSGNFQLLTRLPGALLPWRNPIWLQLVSHKLLRLAAPWALLGLLLSSALLPAWGYHLAFGLQMSGYLLGLVALATPAGRRYDVAGAAGSFLVLNAAAFLAFWVWVSGRAEKSWQRVRYVTPVPEPTQSHS